MARQYGYNHFMNAYKKSSEIRQYCKFVMRIRLAMFSLIPITVMLYLLFASEKNIFLGLICAGLPYFFSILAGLIILNRRYTDNKARRLARFEEKFLRHSMKNLIKEILILISIVLGGYLIVSILNINRYTVSFIPIIVLGFMIIFFRPSIRDPDAEDDIDDEELEEEYLFSEYSPSRPDNFLMDPAHPSSILNPTNPANPNYFHNK